MIEAVIVCLLAGEVDGRTGDLEALLDGVVDIAAPGVPGPLCVFGEQAFPVVMAKQREPVVAAGRMGKGRVVAFGHTGYLDEDSLRVADTGRLMINSVHWAAESTEPRVAVYRRSGAAKFLQEHGLETELLEGDGWVNRLSSFDVLCVQSATLSLDTDVPAIQAFVRDGGGLVAADLGWGWKQLNPGRDLIYDHPGNPLLMPAGIVWADGYLDRTSENGYAVEGAPSELCHAAHALDALLAYSEQKISLEEEEVAQASRIVSRAIRSLPLDDEMLLPKIRNWQQERSMENTPMARVALTLELTEMDRLPPDRIKAHPLAEKFPGAVPADAERVSRTIEIDTGIPDWHSTGLYAAPGEAIIIEVPEEMVGKDFRVRIGAHSDTLWDKREWRRSPDVCRVYPIDSSCIQAANAFGGLIYIVVPRECKPGRMPVKISNAVEAPYYVLGQTDLAEWRERVRYYPGPWAELATDKVVITVPSQAAQELDDPENLMEFWQDVMDACAELGARPLKRERPERYVADEQISAGYMHAGYPLMTHLDVADVMLDRKRMETNEHGGVWGLFHELGHNHQVGDWTFRGTGEVTVNLFTLYIFDKVCGRPPRTLRNFSYEGRVEMLKPYFEGGADFDKWKRDPFLALTMYIQMQEAFGWEAFINVFAEYRDLPDHERPENDDEKRDQWMVRFSRTVGRNLGPFFQAWGVPTSETARDSIADLLVWMPEDWGTRGEGDKGSRGNTTGEHTDSPLR